MEYKECLIENTFFPYRLYGYIHASGYGYTLGHSDHSIDGANSPCCVASCLTSICPFS